MAKIEPYAGMQTEKSERIFTRKIKIPLVPLIIIFVLALVLILYFYNNKGKSDTRVLIESSSYTDESSESGATKSGVVILENGYIYSMKSNYFPENDSLEGDSDDIISHTTFRLREIR